MNLRYDPATDSLHFDLSGRPSADSDELEEGVVLDDDANGALVSIDLQHASQRVDINTLSVSKLPLGRPQAA